VVGLGTTWFALTRDTAFGAVTLGSARLAEDRHCDIDPYARAVLARSGHLPVGSGDGVAFFAVADDKGRSFDGRCELVLSGITPPARVLDRHAVRSEGRLVATRRAATDSPARRSCAAPTAAFEIVVAPRTRAGNWLPTSGVERYLLVWRLYDTPVGAATRTAREAPMPALETKACP